MTSSVIIDRRLSDKGKSSVNRRKFLDRLRGTISNSIRDVLRNTNIKDLAKDGGKEMTIPTRNLKEPTFRHDGSGVNDLVRPGNDRFVPGDTIARPPSGNGSGSKGSPDGEGTDDFTFHLTKDEFMELLFEMCDLPDVVKKTLASVNETVRQRNGFISDGSPAMMNIVRSMRQAKSRRSALKSGKTKQLKKLEQQLADAEKQDDEQLISKLKTDIELLKTRIAKVPYVDPVDLRFNNWTDVEVPSFQAVMICLMDVSGSMDSTHKELAKTFYLLMYLFLTKKYEKVEIRWLVYHSRAREVDEHDFFYGYESGGTVASTGLQLALDTIKENYPTELWNIYMAHATDGDNSSIDNATAKQLIADQLLPILQYYAYIQVSPSSSYYARSGAQDPDNMIHWMTQLAEQHRNLAVQTVTTHSEVYPVFIKLFERKNNGVSV